MLARRPLGAYPVARLLWLAPALLVGISLYLAAAGLEQRATARNGEVVVARIDSVDLRQNVAAELEIKRRQDRNK